MLVYATHTGTRDITERMEQFLSQHGFKVAVLKADTVAPDRRESWVDERVKQGVDVMICHPRLVQTRLDLVDFLQSAGSRQSSSSFNQHKKVRFSWAVDLDASGVE